MKELLSGDRICTSGGTNLKRLWTDRRGVGCFMPTETAEPLDAALGSSQYSEPATRSMHIRVQMSIVVETARNHDIAKHSTESGDLISQIIYYGI